MTSDYPVAAGTVLSPQTTSTAFSWTFLEVDGEITLRFPWGNRRIQLLSPPAREKKYLTWIFSALLDPKSKREHLRARILLFKLLNWITPWSPTSRLGGNHRRRFNQRRNQEWQSNGAV